MEQSGSSSESSYGLRVLELETSSEAETFEEESFIGHHLGRTSTLSTGMSLVTTIIGAGILGFPATFALGGWVASPVLLLFCAWAVLEIGCALEQVHRVVEARMQDSKTFSFERLQSYGDLCEVAFGPSGRLLATATINTFMLFICGAFMILIGKSLEFATGISYRRSVSMTAFLFAGLSLIDDMTVIAQLSSVGVLASATYAVCIGSAGVRAASFSASQHLLLPRASEASTLGAVISVMLLGFMYQTVVPTVRAEMRKPRELPHAIAGAVGLATVVYGTAGALGYYGWGHKVAGDVLESMRNPDGSQMLEGLVLSWAVMANLAVTFPIVMNCVSRCVETVIAGGYSQPVRLLLVFVAFCVGYFIPFFLQFLSLLASVLGVTVGVFLPLSLYWCLAFRGKPVPKSNAVVAARHAAVAVLGLIALVFGTWTSVLELRAAFDTSAPEVNASS